MLDSQKVWAAPEYLEVFRKHFLTSFDSFMGYSQGQRYKKNRYREVWRLEFPGVPPLFLKRHFYTRTRDNLYAWATRHSPYNPAYQELEAISCLQKIGIPTMKPVAFGECPAGFGKSLSFIMTEEISGAVKLERYLVEEQKRWQEDFAFRKGLIEELAHMARRMHEHHIHHQDFYLGHILISWEESGQFRLWLIDLQRMHKRKRLSARWRVKDLAELHYSAPYPVVTTVDRLRFLCYYQGRFPATSDDRHRIAWIERRRHKIELHQWHKSERLKRI